MVALYTPKDVAKVVNLSYRQIQYWDKTNFIKPSHRRRGKYRLYSFSDMFQMYVVKLLKKQQYSIQNLRKVIKRVRTGLDSITYPANEAVFAFPPRDRDVVYMSRGELRVLGEGNRQPYDSCVVIPASTLEEKLKEILGE